MADLKQGLLSADHDQLNVPLQSVGESSKKDLTSDKATGVSWGFYDEFDDDDDQKEKAEQSESENLPLNKENTMMIPVLRPTQAPGGVVPKPKAAPSSGKIGERKESKNPIARLMTNRLDRLRQDRMKAYEKNSSIEEFLDSIPERDDSFPTLVMYHCHTGKRRKSPVDSPARKMLEFIWPLFFWADMIGNMWILLKAMLGMIFSSMMPASGIPLNRGILVSFVLIAPLVYGWYVAARSVDQFAFFPFYDETQKVQLMVFFARAFGKACTLVHFIGVLFATRIVSTMWDTIPHDRRPIGWRKLHIFLCQAIWIFGCIHGAAHFLRHLQLKHVFISYAFEQYAIITGLTLATILLFMNMPYAFLRSKYWSKRWGFQFKKFFRFTHRSLFIVFELIYLIHSTSSVTIVLLMFWIYSLKFYQISVLRFGFRFVYKSKKTQDFISNKVIPPNKRTYVLELKVFFNEEIPMKYGYYCVIQFGLLSASYTMIPLDSHCAMFRIQKCVLTEHIKERLGVMSTSDPNGVFASPSSQFTSLQVFGPYLSGDYNTGNSKKVCVLVSGTGNAVSDALALFNSARRQYWKSLTIINAGSKQLDERYYTVQGIPCKQVPEDPMYKLKGSAQLNHYAAHPRKTHVNLINVNAVDLQVVRKLLLALQYQGFSVVICSALWRHLVDSVLEKDPELAAAAEVGRDADTVNPQMIHIEDFEIA